VATDGEVTRITVPKDKLPLVHAEGSTLFIALAAAAGTAYGTMQARAAGGAPSQPAASAPAPGASPAATTPVAGSSGSDEEKALCHAVQQRLTAAVELYNTDKKKKAKLEEIADSWWQAQYLESRPDDPGQAPGSFSNYFTAPDGRVSCKVHGSPDAETHRPRAGRAREALGSRQPPPPPP